MPKAASGPTLLDRILAAARIGENDDWEFKSAKGGFPANAWETYSAMANTAGGAIVLGVSEKDDQVVIDGLPKATVEQHKKILWASLNNRQVISHNLLSSDHVEVVQFFNGGWALVIHVPQATRKQRPVHRGLNPFGGNTFKRRYDGDHKCSDDEVRRMFVDADDTPADARILDGFSAADFDPASVVAFRNRFASVRPNHVWLNLGDSELLEMLGATRTDRESGKSGVTLAGILMLGKYRAIISPGAAPSYFVDFRDYRGRTSPDDRWTDRVFADGTWEANLFQFYTRCLPKLSSDLKVPFAFKAGLLERTYESPVHVALQEAMVNALIHTDYSVSSGIVIERHDDSYQFSNPGTLLVTEDQLRKGGISECRNKTLQRMFINIGGGDQAGSGYARIQAGWRSQHWRAPQLRMQYSPDRVRLDMAMVSLMPQETFDALHRALGPRLDQLTETARLALATAALEASVTNSRMQDLVSDHPSDITKTLRGLVKDGLLMSESQGQGRWTRYVLSATLTPILTLSNISLGAPVALSSQEVAALIDQTKGRLKPDRQFVEALILHFSHDTYRTAKELAALMQRKSAARLRDNYLSPMVAAGRLVRQYDEFDHPEQAYRAART